MNPTHPHFMYEQYPTSRKVVDKKDFSKIHFLRNFIILAGKAKIYQKEDIKIPIQAIYREEIKPLNIDFSNLKPKLNKNLPIQKKNILPKLTEIPKNTYSEELIEKPKIEQKEIIHKHLPILEEKEKPEIIENEKIEDETISYSKNKPVYSINDENNFKKYGNIGSLMSDEKVTKITCYDKKVFVDYDNFENVLTEIKFQNQKQVNNLIKKFARESDFNISEKNPILNALLPEGFKVHANFGNDFVDATFTIIKEI